jgi:hypothetical protein
MKRNVGNMGEKHFSSLCSAAGITPNKSEIDDKGWDYIIEFPFEISNEYKDLIKTPIKCLVQVKATDNKKCHSWQIKLNNLHHFVKAPLPTFFCLINFDNKDLPQSIHLLHIDEYVIKETLKNLREYSINGQDVKNVKKTIYFEEKHRLKEISGKCLKETIENYISIGMDKYTNQKMSFVKNTGYEDGGANFSLQLNPSQLRDATLGILDEIKFKQFSLFDKRFGICSIKPSVFMDIGTLKIEPKQQSELVVMFSKEKYETGTKIKFKKYCSNLDAHLPFEQRKFRLKSDFVEIIIFADKFKFSFQIEDENKEFLIDELEKNYQLLNIMKSKKQLYISIKHNEDFLSVASIDLNQVYYDINDNFRLFYVAHKYYKILEKYNFHHEISISSNRLYQNEKIYLYFMRSLV